MFEIFKKDDFVGNCCYAINKDNIFATRTFMVELVELSENVEKWEDRNIDDYILISITSFDKENLAFTVMEPSEYAYIKVYKIENYYVAHEYDNCGRSEARYYIIKDIKQFKKDVAKNYSFISYNSNYMEEL